MNVICEESGEPMGRHVWECGHMCVWRSSSGEHVGSVCVTVSVLKAQLVLTPHASWAECYALNCSFEP